MPPSPKQYKSTIKGVFAWAQSELDHVGRIATVEDPDLQYSYALSTVNGMLHLRNAVYELLHDVSYQSSEKDLGRLYSNVNRALQNLITTYNVKRRTIERFNTRQVLGNIRDLRWSLDGGKTRKAVSRSNKTRKN